jgi:hypothetical protein
MRAQMREVLRRPGVRYAKKFRKRCHVALAATNLFDDSQPTWMTKDSKYLGKFSASNGSEWHGAVSFAVGSLYSRIQYIECLNV